MTVLYLHLLFVFGFLSQPCQGLQLTLDVTATQRSRPSCGVLTCLETSTQDASTIDIARHPDGAISANPVRNVTKMAVYKMNGPGTQTVAGPASLVASVDFHNPTVARVANAIKVDGMLGDSVTSLKLELFKQEDCKAQFTCEVLALDSTGREVVKTSHLLQQPSTPASDGIGGEGWTPAVAMQLVNLVMELNLNVELMKNVMDGYKDRMKNVERNVETLDKNLYSLIIGKEEKVTAKLSSVEKDLRDKFDLYENEISDKLASVDRKLYKLTLNNEVIDEKIDSTTKQLEDKLNHQEDKISQSLKTLQDTISDATKVQSSLKSFAETFKNELKEKTYEVYKNNLNSFEINIANSIRDLQILKTSTESNFESLKTEIRIQGSSLTNNLGRAIEDAAFNSSMSIASRVKHSYDLLDENIEWFIKEVASNINASAMETRSALRKTVQSLNITDASEVASHVAEVLTPKTCRKGMNSLNTQPSYPYPVVKPSSDADLTEPFLCDTVTEGGGWIVIQRRTTGKVDFYRTWADYKTGFGTLDDDFWLGNDNIHSLTSTGEYELRVDLRYRGKSGYAHYSKFALSDESGKYVLTVGSYDGTAGDSLSGHSGYPFTTLDRDNDSHGNGVNCAVLFTGAWWYSACHSSNLNGKWNAVLNKGPRWSSFSSDKPVSFSEMKIRKVA